MNYNENVTIKNYNKTVKEYIKKTDKLYPSKEAEKFVFLLDDNSIILDLGCGPGRDAKELLKCGLKVIGIDLSKKMIEAAKKRVKNVEFKVMDMVKLDFQDNSFDGVWANASIFHLPRKDITLVLDEIYRVLKKNGILFIGVKKGKGEGLFQDKRYKGIKKYITYFSKKEMTNLLKDKCFRIINSYVNKNISKYDLSYFIYIFCKKY